MGLPPMLMWILTREIFFFHSANIFRSNYFFTCVRVLKPKAKSPFRKSLLSGDGCSCWFYRCLTCLSKHVRLSLLFSGIKFLKPKSQSIHLLFANFCSLNVEPSITSYIFQIYWFLGFIMFSLFICNLWFLI